MKLTTCLSFVIVGRSTGTSKVNCVCLSHGFANAMPSAVRTAVSRDGRPEWIGKGPRARALLPRGSHTCDGKRLGFRTKP
eukprot:scaffold153_cov347-Pavlova_lutheri.AAC.45